VTHIIIDHRQLAMRIVATALLLSLSRASAFAPSTAFGVGKLSATALNVEIRGPTEKSEVLRFGMWSFLRFGFRTSHGSQ
jgi:hypothetical protein